MRIPNARFKIGAAIIGILALLLLFSIVKPLLEKRTFMPSKGPGVQPDRIVLTLSEDPAASQSVTWRTSEKTTKAWAEIAIATGAPRFWRNARRLPARTERMDARNVKDAYLVANYHSVTFTDLLPDTTYAYRVGDGEHWSEWIHFRTAAAQPKPFAFLYVGDAQNDIMSLWSRLIRAGYSKAPEARFIIHAGDLVNSAHSEKEWAEWFYAGAFIHRMMPSVPVAGNHEYRPYNNQDRMTDTRRLAVQWRPQFTLPENGPAGLEETSYYFDYQGVRFLVLNSNTKREEQISWADSILANNPHPWAIATFHHPIYSASGDRDNPELRKSWKPIFDKHRLDLALQGHDHSYARGRTPAPSTNVMEGVNKLDAATGTVYVVSVSGGKMYELKPDGWESYGAKQDRAAENTQLFQVIQVEGHTLRYRAYTAVGELYDAFDLIKDPNGGPNQFVERMQEAVEERRFDNTIRYHEPES
jgi:3',5'-cyclic AMP phosphodiesterase CpdA